MGRVPYHISFPLLAGGGGGDMLLLRCLRARIHKGLEVEECVGVEGRGAARGDGGGTELEELEESLPSDTKRLKS